MKSLRNMAAVAPVAALVLCQTVSVAQQPTLPSAGRSALSDFLTQSIDRGDVPGVVAAVVNRDTVLFEEAAGKLDETHDVDMPANAIFRMASMTKPITTVAALMLVEQGKLALDDPVSKYVPGFEDAQVITQFNAIDGTYEARPSKRPITIRQLMPQTSGIGYGFSNPVLFQLLKDT